jgi:hypothetical protein
MARLTIRIVAWSSKQKTVMGFFVVPAAALMIFFGHNPRIGGLRVGEPVWPYVVGGILLLCGPIGAVLVRDRDPDEGDRQPPS